MIRNIKLKWGMMDLNLSCPFCTFDTLTGSLFCIIVFLELEYYNIGRKQRVKEFITLKTYKK